MQPRETIEPVPEEEAKSRSRRLRRRLARRFPRTRVLYRRARGLYDRARAAAHGWRARLGWMPRPRRLWATLGWLRALAATLAGRRREERLTVGVEINPFWEPLTGIGWYLYRLLKELAGRDDLRIRLYGPSVVESPDLEPPLVELPSGAAIERVLYRVPDGLIVSAGRLIPILRRLEPLLIAADGNQVLFAPNYFLPRRFRLARGARVATVHDLGFRRVPATLRRETLRDLSNRLEHALFEASRLITVSAAVRDELEEYGYADRERITVVHHGPGQLAGVAPGELPEGTPERYALHVGTLEPRKNILHLLAAWRLLRRRRPEAPVLVLCGRYGWKTDRIRSEVARAEREGWARHLGYVREEELAALYRGALLVVFPSLYEGFGLPAVEAHWAGAPLVCSDLPVLREVAGDAALYAPPQRADLLAARIEELLDREGLRAELGRRGRARAEALSWEAAAERTLGVWRAAAGGRAEAAS